MVPSTQEGIRNCEVSPSLRWGQEREPFLRTDLAECREHDALQSKDQREDWLTWGSDPVLDASSFTHSWRV